MTDIQPGAPLGGPEQVLVSFGDIVVSRSWVVTPGGNAPLRGAQFLLTDSSRTETRTPTWAIVLAILGAFFFLLGLFFLLVKETVTSGFVQVTVIGERLTHTVAIPVTHHAAVVDVYNRVNYARQLVAAAE
ncbi:hypothetical protein M2152_001312 [Microbacteriaceae bacterium SG_E_30_P1]|uniref:HlyD family secretion protein n=1 Tax=Antiquaquibacter oligotrophicus TaxID=2880260 RepID=A0ABT6KMB2_9MICO|nr:hypothetical protein [Antiquaquibacter oligotrophicus]MDH6181130.1 hypothetical protein [Antiquaquibacter oligotrophicus]UDF13173.1 hypothetical protein LH407_13580 [Antiquaquibacter oligotrophicus]